jgi:acetyl-CoA carboxylase carboxyl transferase subunit alpha
MYQHSLFSVASPEAMQAILKRPVGEVDQLLPITAQALQQQGLVDAVLPDTDADTMVAALKTQLQTALMQLADQTPLQLQQQRLTKFQQLQTLV